MMSKHRKPDGNPSNPINLDSEQLKELEELIDTLRKEIFETKKGKGERPKSSEVGYERSRLSAVHRTDLHDGHPEVSDKGPLSLTERIPA
ncbi:MAG: hypothetical protein JSV16_11610 [Candidatus Hydrogenedentota bacterium]|nr:MAG: hypothetical protein JSV16_11610 [Candidatus Hydrogenedentota bacterium]